MQVFIFCIRDNHFPLSLVPETLDFCLETHWTSEDIPKVDLNVTDKVLSGVWVPQDIFCRALPGWVGKCKQQRPQTLTLLPCAEQLLSGNLTTWVSHNPTTGNFSLRSEAHSWGSSSAGLVCMSGKQAEPQQPLLPSAVHNHSTFKCREHGHGVAGEQGIVVRPLSCHEG